jgi:REP element-mobilizing transposase RayT
MTHPYPQPLKTFDYLGRYDYFLTFAAHDRRHVFSRAADVDLVRTQILRAASVQGFALDAYCFMPDHVHLLARGVREDSNARAFISAAKQYSGFHYKQQRKQPLWQRYFFERAIRSDLERAMTIRYMLLNPVRAGLAAHPAEYPFIGSERYTVEELLLQAGGWDAIRESAELPWGQGA